MHPTPLCGPEIVGILESDHVLTSVPTFTAARVMRKPLGRSHSHILASERPTDLVQYQGQTD